MTKHVLMNSCSKYLKRKYVAGTFLFKGVFCLDFSSDLEQLRAAASKNHGSGCKNK